MRDAMTVGAIDAAARQGAGIEVLTRLQDQQKLEGEAAQRLIEAAGEVGEQAPAPAADGTGQLLDVYA